MVKMNLDDPYLFENFRAIKNLRDFGYSDEEIQKLYDEQVEIDKKENSNED